MLRLPRHSLSQLTRLRPRPTHNLRHATTASTTAAAAIPGVLGSAVNPPSSPNILLLNLKLPDVSAVAPDPPPQIPYGPDFWHSNPPAHSAPAENVAPKLLVVAGHAAPEGGPAHSVHESLLALTPDSASSSTPASASSADSATNTAKQGLLGDVLEDSGLTRAWSSQVVDRWRRARHTAAANESDHWKAYARGMDEEDGHGGWLLLGLLVSLWLVAGMMNPTPRPEKKPSKVTKEAVKG